MERLNGETVDWALERAGTCTGEHGTVSASGYLEREHADLQLWFRALKDMFDPNWILNPGKVVRSSGMKLSCPFASSSLQRPRRSSRSAADGPLPRALDRDPVAAQVALGCLPSSTTITGSSSGAGRSRGNRKLRYETPTLISPIVPPTRIAR